MTFHLIEWITGILLGGFLAGYLYRWYCTVIKIDPSFPYRFLMHVEDNGKKWIVINPATPWHVLEAIYILLFRKLGRKPKKEIEASNDRRVQILRKLWIATASTVFFLGTISVAEEFPYLFKIHTDRPDFASKQKEQHNLSVPQPKQNLSAPQPQTSSINESASQELQTIKQDPPKLQTIAEKKTKPHKDEVYKLNERIHKINEKLNKIENQLATIEKQLPNTNKTAEKPLHRLTKETIDEAIDEVNKTISEVNKLKQQIPIVNELELPRILR